MDTYDMVGLNVVSLEHREKANDFQGPGFLYDFKLRR
jgi:hypothetical protein